MIFVTVFCQIIHLWKKSTYERQWIWSAKPFRAISRGLIARGRILNVLMKQWLTSNPLLLRKQRTG
jgi:hypothetical protein